MFEIFHPINWGILVSLLGIVVGVRLLRAFRSGLWQPESRFRNQRTAKILIGLFAGTLVWFVMLAYLRHRAMLG